MLFSLFEYHCQQIFIVLNTKINIAIDGNSSCGKGTLAKNLAKSLGYLFVDSGAMYRAVSLYLIRQNIDLNHLNKNPQRLQEIDISFHYSLNNDFFETYLNGERVDSELQTSRVANFVGQVSQLSVVRDFIKLQQQKLALQKGVVMDGRDIGTKVIPDAELKIFMTADPLIRAKRRFNEILEKQIQISFDEVVEHIKRQDEIDNSLNGSALIKADDAIILDSTNMSKAEQTRVALSWAKGVIAVQY